MGHGMLKKLAALRVDPRDTWCVLGGEYATNKNQSISRLVRSLVRSGEIEPDSTNRLDFVPLLTFDRFAMNNDMQVTTNDRLEALITAHVVIIC